MPIETNNLISPEQIIDFPISDSVSYEYSFLSLQKLKMNTLENEMNLSIAKSRQLLDFVQAKYIGKSENLFEDNLSIGLGINLPFFGAARQDKSEFYFEKTVKESKLNKKVVPDLGSPVTKIGSAGQGRSLFLIKLYILLLTLSLSFN